MGVRATNDLDLFYVESASLSGLRGTRKQNAGMLDVGIHAGVAGSMCPITSAEGRGRVEIAATSLGLETTDCRVYVAGVCSARCLHSSTR